jgi:CelD/BcsL family acetyltransferase involved in cellulose biosynthesis
MPDSSNVPYDVRDIIGHVVDDGTFFEVHELYAPNLVVGLARLDGRPAAARYGFRYGRTYYAYQSGFDPAYAGHWIGVISLALSIRSSLEEGAGEHDLLAGNEPYKSRLAPAARELARATTETKNRALSAMAAAIREQQGKILRA